MEMLKKLAIGVDVGGSHVSCAAYDLYEGRYLAETFSEHDLDNHAPAGEIIAIWGAAIGRTLKLAGNDNVAGIGFAMPGPFEYDKGISRFRGENGKYENTYGLDVPHEIISYLGLSPDFRLRFINDATAFAIGEDRFGKARDFSRSLSVTLGTGFGSAFIKDTMPVLEGDEVPYQGCFWHLPFKGGIADDYFSTRGLLNRYKLITGRDAVGVKELANLAPTEPSVKGIFDDFGYKMGSFLKPWMQKFDCEVLVLGGNISHALPLFENSLINGLAGSVAEVRLSQLRETASMIGSAHLVDDAFYNRILPLLSLM